MRIVKSTPHKLEDRTAGSQIGFNGLNQYASAGVNPNIIHAVDYFKDFTICFFLRVIEPHSEKTGNPENAWPWTMYQRFDAGSVFRYNGFGIVTSKSGAPSGKYRMRFIMGRDRPYEGYVAGEANASYHKGALYHIAVTYNSTSLFQFFVNGVKMPMHPTTKLGSGVIQGSIWDYGHPPFLLGTGLDLHNIHEYYSESNTSHFMVFNKILSHDEIKPMAKKGKIPSSARGTCVAHYPCTQPNGLQIFDTVGQYNHKKPVLLFGQETNFYIPHPDRITRLGKRYTITNNAGTATAINLDVNGALTDYENDDGVVVHVRYRTNDIWFMYARNESATTALHTQNLGNTAGEWQEAYFYWKHDYTIDVATRANVYLNFTNGGGLGSAYAVGSYIEFDFIRISKQLKPFHADLVNFTDLETGTSLSSSNQAWKDFYQNGKNYLAHHFQISNYYGTSSGHDIVFSASNHANWAIGSDDFEYYATFSASSYANMSMRPFYKPDTNWITFTVHTTAGLILEVNVGNGMYLGKIVAVQPISELFVPGNIHTVAFKKITNDAANWKLILDGRELDFIVESNTLGATVLNSVGTIRFFSNAAASFTLRAYETKFIVGNITRGHWQWNNRAGSTVTDLTGHSDITIKVPDSLELYAGGKYWRENKSDKPALINALKFTAATRTVAQISTEGNTFSNQENVSYLLSFYYPYTTFGQGTGATEFLLFHGNLASEATEPNNYVLIALRAGTTELLVQTMSTTSGGLNFVTDVKHGKGFHSIVLNLPKLSDISTQKAVLFYNGSKAGEAWYNNTDGNARIAPVDLSRFKYFAVGKNIRTTNPLDSDAYVIQTALTLDYHFSAREASQMHNNTFFSGPKLNESRFQVLLDYNRAINTNSLKNHGIIGGDAALSGFADLAGALTSINTLR
ncbi:LamG domain-containing protein [Catalinimonas niigatensis]|uniref:hypothetical protein n=1 Tax=Catalinimonas niigatensis TaxID=1397264 RepID=UPI0026663572|nr:hypothetical protein [Catalinimonas niigatensis]WPP49664.1 hypothetical protein PZB72_23600 [Catalinimonas niigatensis]